jgi:hypothetical protein
VVYVRPPAMLQRGFAGRTSDLQDLITQLVIVFG